MATYFHGSSDIQAAGGGDGLQTLILMNPSTGYVGFSDRQPPPPTHPPPGNNLVFFNSSNTPGGNSLNLIHAPPSQQLVGIPLTSATTNPLQDDHQQDISSFHAFLPRVHEYNPYSHNFDHTVAREYPRSLSLRLSSQQQQPSNYGSNIRPDEHHEVIPSQPLVTATLSPMGAVNVAVSAAGASPSSASRNSDDVNGMQGVILNSKFLKATQELLDEVVNVNKGLKNSADSGKGVVGLTKSSRELTSETSGATTGEGQSNREITGKINESELTTTERQEIQMKKAKLVHMLDEVEQRYRQYHHQMQVVISWFEPSAGIGSAKPYTALALQTISRRFRCLKDAISSQVRAASRRLGEEDSLSGKNEGSKLKFIDNQLRQQRALQHLGMVQHNAWRPQRGLPERSVSVLRAWLFEHFLHPYPKESDKFMLAKQTGLTRSQVSNWFINARVRLWKPMVEEMYIEEMKEQEKKEQHVEEESGKSEHNEEDSLSPEKASTLENQNKALISNDQNALNPNVAPQKPPSLIDSEEMERLTQASPKKPRNNVILHSPTSDLNNESLSMNFSNERQNREGFSFVEGFGSYPIAELGRFSADQFQAPYSGNGFSLTLGLPQWGNLTMHGQHQPFLSNQNIQMNHDFEVGDTMDYSNKVTQSSNQGTNVYENINIQDRKRLAAQFLPGFVA